MTTLAIQQQWRDAKIDLDGDAGQTEGHIHPIVEAVEIDWPLPTAPVDGRKCTVRCQRQSLP